MFIDFRRAEIPVKSPLKNLNPNRKREPARGGGVKFVVNDDDFDREIQSHNLLSATNFWSRSSSSANFLARASAPALYAKYFSSSSSANHSESHTSFAFLRGAAQLTICSPSRFD